LLRAASIPRYPGTLVHGIGGSVFVGHDDHPAVPLEPVTRDIVCFDQASANRILAKDGSCRLTFRRGRNLSMSRNVHEPPLAAPSHKSRILNGDGQAMQ
jgi:hypothetical protein